MHQGNERSSQLEIFLIYLRLGCLSFGGPVAHLGYFKEQFVNQRRWLDESKYAELLGICQFVPGPSSSQLGFAIGWHRGGLSGACAAWLGFTLPSTLLMIGFAYGIYSFGNSLESIVSGLLVAAVAVVANATLGLAKTLCPDLPRIAIALLSTTIVFLLPSSYAQMLAIGVGATLGLLLYSKVNIECNVTKTDSPHQVGSSLAITALCTYGILLALSIWFSANDPGGIYAVHYRAGALVFGGGHVVLPLLNDSLVAGGLLEESTLLAGYSAAQTLPGPLFTLSGFIGTVGGDTNPRWIGGIGALIAIFLPGLLLLVGLLPYWNRVRQNRRIQSCLTGANAAVVGLLLAALIFPVSLHGINNWLDGIMATVAFIMLYYFKVSSWIVVIACGAMGMIIY